MNNAVRPSVRLAFTSAFAVSKARTTSDGTTALIVASWGGRLDVVRVLLTAKADVNAKRTDGRTALCMASLDGHLEVVKALVAANADVNARTADGATALTIASQKGHRGVVQFLNASP